MSREGETEEPLDARIDVIGLDGQHMYSVTAEDSFIWDFALQDDGKVAWLQRRHVERGPGALAWASPAEPWAHVVARDVPIGGVPIGFGRDRILFGRRVRPGLESWQPWIATLAGVARPTWFALAAPFGQMRADFDGERLAVAGRVRVGRRRRARTRKDRAAGARRRSPAKGGDRCDAKAAGTPTPSRA